MSKKILLVGGTGYLGSHLKEFLSEDFEVFISGTSHRNQDKYFQIDFNDLSTFQGLKDHNFDLIFILSASIKGLGNSNLENVDLTINTVRLGSFLQYIVDENLTSKLVFTSSMTVYGVNNSMPVEESGILIPISVYGLSKVIGEQLVSFLSTQNAIQTLIVRLPGIYGGNRKGGFVYHAILNAFQDNTIQINGHNIGYWECIEINDLCILLKSVLLNYNWEKNQEIINVGYGIKTDIVETSNFIVQELASKSAVELTGAYDELYMSSRKREKISDVDVDFHQTLKKYIKKITS